MTDTGSFRFPGASAAVHRMVAALKDTGINHTQIHEELFDNFLENRLRFTGFVLQNRMEIFYRQHNYGLDLLSPLEETLVRYEI